MNYTDADNPKPPTRPPNCLKCTHFKISFDKRFHGNAARECTVFGLRSEDLPTHAVFRATGAHCPTFSLKEGLR